MRFPKVKNLFVMVFALKFDICKSAQHLHSIQKLTSDSHVISDCKADTKILLGGENPIHIWETLHDCGGYSRNE